MNAVQMAERMASTFPVQPSGIVSFDDFIQTSDSQLALRKIFGAIKKAMGKGRTMDLFHTWLSKYDKDNSGTFSVNEMCDAIEDAAGGGVLATAEIVHLKRAIDSDRCGTVNSLCCALLPLKVLLRALLCCNLIHVTVCFHDACTPSSFHCMSSLSKLLCCVHCCVCA